MVEKNVSVNLGSPFKNAVFKLQWAMACMRLNPTKENKQRFNRAVLEIETLGS